MVTADSYYNQQEGMATTAKARRAQNYAKRMLDMIAEFGLLAKNSLLPAYIGLFAYVDELMKRSRNDASSDLSHASAVEKASIKAMPQPAMPTPKSPLMAQSKPQRIQFRNALPLQVKSMKESLLVIPTNVNSGPSKPEVKAERKILRKAQMDGRIVFRPEDMALKPTANLARPKELELAQQAVRDEKGNLVFLSAEERKKRERAGKIAFWKSPTETANTNDTPIMILRRHRSI